MSKTKKDGHRKLSIIISYLTFAAGLTGLSLAVFAGIKDVAGITICLIGMIVGLCEIFHYYK